MTHTEIAEIKFTLQEIIQNSPEIEQNRILMHHIAVCNLILDFENNNLLENDTLRLKSA